LFLIFYELEHGAAKPGKALAKVDKVDLGLAHMVSLLEFGQVLVALETEANRGPDLTPVNPHLGHLKSGVLQVTRFIDVRGC